MMVNKMIKFNLLIYFSEMITVACPYTGKYHFNLSRCGKHIPHRNTLQSKIFYKIKIVTLNLFRAGKNRKADYSYI